MPDEKARELEENVRRRKALIEQMSKSLLNQR